MLEPIPNSQQWERGPRIVAIGGGTGLSTMLRGLKNYTRNLTAVVTVADDGGGSGMLRRDMGMPPPGDIRHCMESLANVEPIMQRLLTYRFTEGALAGQSFGNLILAALNGVTGSFEEAVSQMSQVLAITGRVIPVTSADVQLEAVFENGTRVVGESKIYDFKKQQDCRIHHVALIPERPRALPSALEAIREADLILLGPGSLYTSVIPNLLVEGVPEAIAQSDALKIYVCNIMTQDGETEGYTAGDHLEALMNHGAPGLVDLCLANSAPVRWPRREATLPGMTRTSWRRRCWRSTASGRCGSSGGRSAISLRSEGMTFGGEVKNELCRAGLSRKCCAQAEAYGVLLYCNTFCGSEIRIVTEHEAFAQRLPALFRKAFRLSFDRLPEGEGKRVFSIQAPDKLRLIHQTYGVDPEALALHINFAALEESCCRAAFFRGAFLSGGSVTDPRKGYHLELATSHRSVSREMLALLREEEFAPKDADRKGNSVIYFKQSEYIEDFLTAIGAPVAAMDVMTAKLEKDLRGSVNRRVNCDAANLDKVVEAAQGQLEAIRRLERSGRLETLPDKLQEAARLRAAHPEDTLAQLAEQCSPPVTKSALNHRLRKLVELGGQVEDI